VPVETRISRLNAVADLHSKGLLTDDEFNRLKVQILE